MMLVLGVGITLATAIFALTDPYILRPLPYQRAEDLLVIRVREVFRPEMWTSGSRDVTFAEWERRTEIFHSLSAYGAPRALRVQLPSDTALITCAPVTRRFFDALGTNVPEWESAAASVNAGEIPVVITAAVFNRVFGANADAIGRAFDMADHRRVRIVAVLPPAFVFPTDWTARSIDAMMPLDGGDEQPVSSLTLIARVKRDVRQKTVAQALDATLAGSSGGTVQVQSLKYFMTRSARPFAIGAGLAVAVVLLICIGNIVNLFMLKSVYRARELATRAALGAMPLDLVRLLLVEYTITAAGALCLATLFSWWILIAARTLIPNEYLLLGSPYLTPRVGAAAAASAALAIGLAWLPLWLLLKTPERGLFQQTTPVERAGARRMRLVGLAVQNCFAMLVVTVAVFLSRSYINLMAQTTGFSGDPLVMTVSYPSSKSGPRLRSDIDDVLLRLRSIPGVDRVAASINGPMLDKSIWLGTLVVRGEALSVVTKRVTPGYFAAIGTRVLAGREFDGSDRGATAVVINETLARRSWPDGNAVGQMVGGSQPTRIVGVVQDTFDVALDSPPRPSTFWPLDNPNACVGDCNNVSYVIRAADAREAIAGTARRIVREATPDAATIDVSSIDDRLSSSVRNRSFATVIMGLFGVVAIVVSVAGIVGAVGFAVRRRTRELAIRIALGARPRQVVSTAMGETFLTSAAGLCVGLCAGWIASRLLARFLYGVAPGDGPTTALAAVLMLVAAVSASAIPAARALGVDPTTALRVE
jgi:putative ABC transport system permease protein